MSRNGRLVAIAATLVVLVVAFIVLSPGDDEPTTATTTQGQATQAATSTPTSTAPAPPPPETPNLATVVVRASEPVGGVKRIEVKKGSRVTIQVSSPDTTDEVHLHGYDISRDLKAGGAVRLEFTAKTDGIYELELEGAHAPIAELVVSP